MTRSIRLPDAISADEYRALLASEKRRKYNSQPVEIDGIRFASRAEARRYGELLWQERDGMIHDLECQPRYRLEVNGVKICDYAGDFRYTDAQTGAVVVEDVKGGDATKTPVYRLKRRLMLACHGIEVKEIEA